MTLTYNAIHYGEENKIDNRRGMKGFYRSLKPVVLPSCYKVAVITRACAVIKSRKKSQKRGLTMMKRDHPLRPSPSGGRSQQAASEVRDEEEGLAGEARKRNPPQTVILRVDASKLPTRSFVGEE